MSPFKREWPIDEEQQDDMLDDQDECLSEGGDTVTNVGDLGMLGDVLLDILDELSRLHELLRRHMEHGSRVSVPGPT